MSFFSKTRLRMLLVERWTTGEHNVWAMRPGTKALMEEMAGDIANTYLDDPGADNLWAGVFCFIMSVIFNLFQGRLCMGREITTALMNQIEGMWSNQDILFEELNSANGWGQKHGRHWTFADVPYHLTYTNRDVVIYALEKGEAYPSDEQVALAMTTLNLWNEHKLAQRPADQTPQQTLEQLDETRQLIRAIEADMTDNDLAQPAFLLISSVWVTKQDVLTWCLAHDFSEFLQLRIHMGRSEPVPAAETANVYLNLMLHFFPAFLNKDAAAGVKFSAVMDFTDAGVGAWTLQVSPI